MSEPITARKNRFPYTFSPLPKDSHLVTRRLSPSGKDIYSYIVGRVDGKQKTGWTFKVSDADMQDTFGYRRETVSRARQEIQSLGLAIQLPHAHRQCRMFYIGTLEQVRWMRIALVVTFIKMAKRHSAMEAIKRLRSRDAGTCSAPASQSQNCEQTVTEVCADGHKVVSVSSQETDAGNPPNPRPQRVSSDDPQTVQESLQECIQEYPPPISPSSVEKLSLAWNESHEYEEGEEEAFDKYFDKAIRATMAQYAVDENVATAALARAFHRTKRNHAGYHPFNFPTAYTGDPDHEESNATPRGKKILQGAIHAVKAGEVFTHKPLSSSNDSTVTEEPTAETVKRQCPDKGSAPPAEPVEPVEPSPVNTPQTPLATVRRNLAGRAAMLKAGIISPMSRDEVLSHAQPGLDAFDDIPGDDVILGVWNELSEWEEAFQVGGSSSPEAIDKETSRKPHALAPDVVEPFNTSPEPAEQSEPKTTDAPFGWEGRPHAFMELGEIQAKIVGLDEMRRSGTLSVDEVAEVTQEIANLKRQKAKVQRDSDNSSVPADKNTDKGVSDGAGAIVSPDEGSRGPTQAEIDTKLLSTWDDDRWLDWVSEHVDKCVRIRQMLCESPIGEDISPYTDEEIETMRNELLEKYPETDEQRLQWIANRINTVSPDDKHASATTGVIVSPDGCTTDETLTRRIAKTIKSSLMASKEYSDEQIVTIVQRQDRSIDSDAILEVWYNWSDWSAYLKGMVNQRIQSGSLMPDEVLEARSYAARLRDFQRKNDQFQAVR